MDEQSKLNRMFGDVFELSPEMEDWWNGQNEMVQTELSQEVGQFANSIGVAFDQDWQKPSDALAQKQRNAIRHYITALWLKYDILSIIE